ncbi:protein SGT1 homolog isoform X2 [Coffea arabica]|uniref:Protein SGT1 homolog isoform X2 n=1 Tax=Coffea arabica TaxID=13443 RepID=A0ABM4WCF0_COFAR
MASSDLETRAKEAFIDDHFELAVDLYSQAISVSPTNAELFADRAQANIKLNNFTEAVADANKAIELDPSMPKAYFRKGLACIKLEEYQTAKTALEVGASLAPGDSRFNNLIKECDQRIAEENGVLPNKSPEAPIVVDTTAAIPKVAEPAISISNQTTSLSSAKPKYRYEVLSTKIEICLAKAEAVHWVSLEYSRDNVALQRINVSSGSQRPTYPSSRATKDWDKLEAQMKKEEKDEKLDGDAALNKFFRDIYKDADEDTRRAMMKSFVESNGTVLSTNWKEVGAKKVEGSPPDGMEMKKWEY